MGSAAESDSGIGGPYLLNLDQQTWNAHLDAASTWLANVVTAQTAYREIVESTVEKLRKPNVHLYLSQMLETAGGTKRSHTGFPARSGARPVALPGPSRAPWSRPHARPLGGSRASPAVRAATGRTSGNC